MPKPPSRSAKPQNRDLVPADDVLTAPPPAETAAYVAEMAAELSSLARHAKLDLLAYILDMARLEATNASRHARSLDGR